MNICTLINEWIDLEIVKYKNLNPAVGEKLQNKICQFQLICLTIAKNVKEFFTLKINIIRKYYIK